MKKLSIYMAILILNLGLSAPLGAADYPVQQEAPSLEETMAILSSLEVDPSPIFDDQASLHDLNNYLAMIYSIRSKKNNAELYAGIESLIQSSIEGKIGSEVSSIPEQEELPLNVATVILDSLIQDPSTISNPATPITELESYLDMIESIRKSEGNQSAYEVLESLIQSEKETRSRQSAPRPKREKSPEQIQKEEITHSILGYLTTVSPLLRIPMINSYPKANLENMLNYMWDNGLVNNPQFKTTYQFLAQRLLSISNQAEINNLQSFDKDAQYIEMPTNDNPAFGFYIVNMNKIKIDGHPAIQTQQGLDCGFHAAFNGLELYRFAKGLINKDKLEDLLPNFDVDKWKTDPRYSCSGASYISSDAIDNILKNHGLIEKDYSIVESIEEYQISMDIVQKLAITLFDPTVTQFTHIIIINSQSRDHWTVAVVNKTGDQIRIYTADSMFGDVEAENIKKIMQLVSKVNVKEEEFETLMKINRALSTIADIQDNENRSIASKNESTIITLLSLLPALYNTNVAMKSYFLESFQQPLLRHIATQEARASGIVKRILEQLKTVIETSDLPNLPPINFEQKYTTILDKYALTTLLELYHIQGRLNETLADASAQDTTKVFDAIESVRVDLANNNALRNLQNAIPIRTLPNIDLDKEYQTTNARTYLLSQLEMYRAANQFEQLLAQSNPEQIGKVLNAIQMVRSAFNFRQAFNDLATVINSFIQKEKE